MNDEQIKFLLGAARPGARDAADPAFAEALRRVAEDPKLRVWFEREQAFGSVVAEKVRTVAPPAGLREAILAGGRLSARTPWWRRPAALAMAAGLAVMITVVSVVVRLALPAAATDLPEFALKFAGRGYIGLQEHSADVEKLKAWLASQNAPLPAKIPTELAQLQGLGCRTVDFQGKNISLICFEEGREFHLFVARRADFPAMLTAAEPRFRTSGAWASASWSDESNHYVLVSDAGEKAVRRFL